MDNLQIDQASNISCIVFPEKNSVDENGMGIVDDNIIVKTIDDNSHIFVVDSTGENEKVDETNIFKSVDEKVLCNDLLDLANDKAEKKINEKDKGTHSDEVRIMEKVLGPKARKLILKLVIHIINILI